MKFNKKKHTIQGSTLIEVLIATVVLTTVLIALVSVLTYSIKSTSESKSRSVATSLAREAIEVFERQRAILTWSGFNTYLGGNNQFCLADLPAFESNCDAQTCPKFSSGQCTADDVVTVAQTDYLREATVSYSANAVIVTINVSWPDIRGETRSTSLTKEFRDW